jgi:hypothetical protein
MSPRYPQFIGPTELCKAASAQLPGLAYRIPRKREHAEDCGQDAFPKICQHWDQLQ